ncbi:MAG: dihydroorotase [Flavobacteriales bacterium]|nr:dihydroorotase [Flavobacteriales bacterium]MBK9597600.1 dihydroorotase [Flavobacteriales bacterium]QQS72242.1 MAG: dihydroorotase [Flavobacteriales bacterium]HQV39900.1 dihydroorotase [Flavobacteriales bacterium]HQW33455.1 dihydroorotase [Flavobacteriales bacterium]
MKDVLLRQVKVLDPGGPLHDTVTDLQIVDGRITKAGAKLPKGQGEVVEIEGLHVSPGWVDLRAHFRDPGEEYKEGLTNGLDAAAAGGFTAVAVLPNTAPPVDQRATVEYLLRKGQDHAVRVLPLGALTKGLKGEQLAELYDMHQAGAVAFTDDVSPARNTRLMLLALQYVKNFDGRVMAFAQDAHLSAQGQMHEGVMSTRLGMRGIPAMAGSIQLARDLELLEYTGSRLHVDVVSTAEEVELIRRAKAKKLNVTASVAAHHLLLDDGCLRGFDTNYKVMPPLRDPAHIEALREGVKDGTIDSIVSDHRPEDTEHKKVEFAQAAFGMIGLETAYSVANTALKSRMTARRIVERFCQGPRAALGLSVPHLVEGEMAEITLFAPEHQWMFSDKDIVSRSRNTPFIGHRFTGKALGVVANGQVKLNTI